MCKPQKMLPYKQFKYEECKVGIKSTKAPLVYSFLTANNTVERDKSIADFSLLERIHPGICVRVALAIPLPCQPDRHLPSLPVGQDPAPHLPANILGDKVTSQLGKGTLPKALPDLPAWVV